MFIAASWKPAMASRMDVARTSGRTLWNRRKLPRRQFGRAHFLTPASSSGKSSPSLSSSARSCARMRLTSSRTVSRNCSSFCSWRQTFRRSKKPAPAAASTASRPRVLFRLVLFVNNFPLGVTSPGTHVELLRALHFELLDDLQVIGTMVTRELVVHAKVNRPEMAITGVIFRHR